MATSDWEAPVSYGKAYSVRHRPSGQTFYCPSYDDVQRLLTGSPPRRRSRLLAWWRGHRRSLATVAAWVLVIFLTNVEARILTSTLRPPTVSEGRGPSGIHVPAGGLLTSTLRSATVSEGPSQVRYPAADLILSNTYTITSPTVTQLSPNVVWWARCLNCADEMLLDNLDAKLTRRDDPRWLPAYKARRVKRRGR